MVRLQKRIIIPRAGLSSETAAAMGAGALAGISLFPEIAGSQNTKDSTKSEGGEKKPQGDPPVRIPDVSIRMRSPDSFLVGVTTSEIIEIKLADVLKFHGYCAGGVAFSFRASQEAFRILYGEPFPFGKISKSKPLTIAVKREPWPISPGLEPILGQYQTGEILSCFPRT